MPETLPNQELRNKYSKTIRLEGGHVAQFFEEIGLSSNQMNELSQAASQSPQHQVAVEGFPGLEMQAPSVEAPQVKVMTIDEQVTRARFEAIRDHTATLENRDIAVVNAFAQEVNNQLNVLYTPVDMIDMLLDTRDDAEFLFKRLDIFFQNNLIFQRLNGQVNSAIEWLPIAKTVMKRANLQNRVNQLDTMESNLEVILKVAEKVKTSLATFQTVHQNDPRLTMQFRSQVTNYGDGVDDLRKLSQLLTEQIHAVDAMETAEVPKTPDNSSDQSSEVDKLTSTVQ